MSLSFGRALRAKKVSASCWSAVEAAEKQKPVMTPLESTALNKLKPSYQPMLLDHPMSACPASHPCPRRSQSRVSIALSYPKLRKEDAFAPPTKRPGAQ